MNQVDAVLAVTQQQERLWLESQHLPADLAADAASSPGDQDGFVGEVGGDLGQVDLGRHAPQQVFDRDVAQLHAEEAAFEEILHAGKGAEPHQSTATGPDDIPDHLARSRWNRDDDLLDLFLMAHPVQNGAIPEDFGSMDDRTKLPGIIIEEAHDRVRQLLVASDLPRHAFPATACAINQNPLGTVANLAEYHLPDRLEVGEREKNPGCNPGESGQEQAKNPVHDEDRPGKLRMGSGQKKDHFYNG